MSMDQYHEGGQVPSAESADVQLQRENKLQKALAAKAYPLLSLPEAMDKWVPKEPHDESPSALFRRHLRNHPELSFIDVTNTEALERFLTEAGITQESVH